MPKTKSKEKGKNPFMDLDFKYIHLSPHINKIIQDERKQAQQEIIKKFRKFIQNPNNFIDEGNDYDWDKFMKEEGLD